MYRALALRLLWRLQEEKRGRGGENRGETRNTKRKNVLSNWV